jgi:hypothetical protein
LLRTEERVGHVPMPSDALSLFFCPIMISLVCCASDDADAEQKC